MKIPKPRAKIGDVVVIKNNQYKIEKASFNQKKGWHYINEYLESDNGSMIIKEQIYTNKDILANLTTGEYFDKRFEN